MSIRQTIKAIIVGVSVIAVSPLIALSWVEKRLWPGSEVLFQFGAQSVALLPGLPGAWLRGAYYFGTLDRCSWENRVGFGSLFTHRGGRLGVRASMGSYCVLGHADVGDEAMIGSRVSVPSGKRQHLAEDGSLTATSRYDTVRIGRKCWIGEGAIVMADIGAESIVSAGAVVLKDMPENCLIGGNPARIIRSVLES